MSWELYEVWQEDEYGHEALIDTTKSEKEALALANDLLKENDGIVKIYREIDGDLEEKFRLTINDSGAIINV
jgi:hypothetical protein